MSFNGRVVIVTGELSGEVHASNLIRSINNLRSMKFSGLGSTRLAEEGMEIVYDYRSISLVGISELFSKAGNIRAAYRILRQHLLRTSPALVILVDFPGFNLLVARMARKLGIPVIYFIPPQVWAWRKGRINKIKSYVNLVICILPFEEELYRDHEIPVCYVGHPYSNRVKPLYSSKHDFRHAFGIDDQVPVITMMPGSRLNEARKHMPVLLKVIEVLERELGEVTILLPVAETIEEDFFRPYIGEKDNVHLIKGFPHDCLKYADAALIASGSATLEAAILGAPSVVLYKVSLLSYLIARIVVRTRHISLPNIIAGKEIFPEFIQSLSAEEIANSVISMLNNDNPAIYQEMEQLQNRLTAFGGDSYRLASERIIQFLEHTYGPLS